ncbi:hypothetical protein LC593_18450 [Nostoc sp. CHAB 5844]|nr:hypothetical protein [Nostoc sp. CHAB 5844]
MRPAPVLAVSVTLATQERLGDWRTRRVTELKVFYCLSFTIYRCPNYLGYNFKMFGDRLKANSPTTSGLFSSLLKISLMTEALLSEFFYNQALKN